MGFSREKKRIIKLKKLAEANPRRFKIQLAFVVACGYAVVFLYFLSLVALITLLIIFAHRIPVRLIILLFILLFFIARAFFQRIPPPSGLAADKEKYSELFAVIQEAKELTNGPDLYKVMINHEFNASVIQIPRLWLLFGGYRNYLTLGLPLLASLSAEDLKAALCHEFGHLTKEHSKFRQRVIKIAAVYEMLGELNIFILLLFYPFLKIYFPILEGYIAVYQRSDEYEADRIAFNAVGKTAYAAALWKFHVLG